MLLPETRADHHSLLDAPFLRTPDDSTALVYLATDAAPITLSRAQLAAAVQLAAAGLAALGLGERDLIVIAHTQNVESIVLFWAALSLGAVPSMFPTLTEKLDPARYMQGMAELARRSEVRAVLTTDAFAPILAENFARHQVAARIFGSSDVKMAARPLPAPVIDEAAIALLQHSSGTTGLQKGVALSHRALLNQMAAYSAAIALDARDVVVSWLPLYHDMGLIAGFLLPLMQGIPLILMSPFDWVAHPAMLLRAIGDYRGTLCWLPNFAYAHLARRVRRGDLTSASGGALDLASMRMFINCSEPVSVANHAAFLDRFAAFGLREQMLAVCYAMAENTFAITQTAPGQPPTHDGIDARALEQERRARPAHADLPQEQISVRVSCGKPIPGCAVRVLDESGGQLPERAVGEIALQSNSMLTEYYRRPDLDPFQHGWVRTGDLGYLAAGEVYIVGRKKDLIIVNGKNIFPQDIEAIVNTVLGVAAGRVAAFGVWDAREGTERVVVVAERAASDGADLQAQDAALAAQIRAAAARAAEVTLSEVLLVDARWLIKTSSGKIARAACREKWQAEREQAISPSVQLTQDAG